MSGLVKSVKKQFKKVVKVVKKVVKSKVFKFVVAAAAIYFGGAGIASMMNGGSFMTGVSSAAGSLSSAGSSLMAGEFGTAASTVGNAWGTAATAGASEAALATTVSSGLSSGVGNAGLNASGGLSAGSANATNAITMNGVTPAANMAGNSANLANVGAGVGGNTASAAAVNGTGVSLTGGQGLTGFTANPSLLTTTTGGGSSVAASGGNALWQADTSLMNAANGGTGVGAQAANLGVAETAASSMSAGEGLMWSAGINAGTQAVGGYLNARSQEKMLDEERERRRKNMMGKEYGSGFQYNIQSAFTPKTLDELRGA